MSSIDENSNGLSSGSLNSTNQINKQADQQTQPSQYFHSSPEVNNNGTQMYYTFTPFPIYKVSNVILLPSILHLSNPMLTNSQSLVDNPTEIIHPLQIYETEYYEQESTPSSLIIESSAQENTDHFLDSLARETSTSSLGNNQINMQNSMSPPAQNRIVCQSPDSISISTSSNPLSYKAQPQMLKHLRPILPKPSLPPIRIFEVENSNFNAADPSQETVHNDKLQDRYKKDFFICSHCEKIFESTDECREHAKRHANTEQIKENNRASTATSSKFKGDNPKPTTQYVCSVDGCEETYNSTSDLNAHRESHGIKLFACTWPSCGKKFAYKFNLYRHEKSHGVRKMFYCHLCKKEYHRSDVLQAHINRVHGNLKMVRPE